MLDVLSPFRQEDAEGGLRQTAYLSSEHSAGFARNPKGVRSEE